LGSARHRCTHTHDCTLRRRPQHRHDDVHERYSAGNRLIKRTNYYAESTLKKNKTLILTPNTPNSKKRCQHPKVENAARNEPRYAVWHFGKASSLRQAATCVRQHDLHQARGQTRIQRLSLCARLADCSICSMKEGTCVHVYVQYYCVLCA
jgi:hypothetical protein